ncbi:MAG: hypothetical protein AB7I19_08690 [Planctomycetota bacterium]
MVIRNALARRGGLLLFVAQFFLAGCMLGRSVPKADAFTGAPTATTDADRLAMHARDLIDRGDDRAALERADAALALDPRQIDAHRVRQDVLRRRGRHGLVWAEADRRLSEWGHDAESLYLRGRIEPNDHEKRTLFERALQEEPTSFWAWFGLAYSVRQDDPVRSLSTYLALADATARFEIVQGGLAGVLHRLSREALDSLLAKLRERSVESGRIDLLAATWHAGRDPRAAWAPLLSALRDRPFDPDVREQLQRRVLQGVSEDQVRQVLDVLEERVEHRDAFVAGGGGLLFARLCERIGRVHDAREVLAQARPVASVRRQARRLALAAGDLRDFLSSLAADLPVDVIEDESNQIRGPWTALRALAVDPPQDPISTAGAATQLLDRLMAVGLLEEAAQIATIARSRHADPVAIARFEAVRAQARAELAFEAGLRRMLYRGYANETVSLSAFLEQVRELSLRVLGSDVVGQPTTYSVPFVGRLVDPFGAGLPAHLRRFNRHLILGQRDGAPPEGLLVTMLSVRDLDDGGPLPIGSRAYEVVGEDRQIDSLEGVLGGDLAGVALLHHYVIDYDAIRDWGLDLREARTRSLEDGHAVLRDPLPADVEPLAALDVGTRLLALSPVEDRVLESAVFDLVRWHERAHLLDAVRFLPPESNLWRVVALVVRNGFQADSVQAELEGRAEAASLAYCRHPELALAHIAGFLRPEAGRGPHARGFRELARRLNDLTTRAGLDGAGAVSRWHLIPAASLAGLARVIVAEHWPR